MNEFQSEIITHLVYTFAEKANITNQDENVELLIGCVRLV